MGGTNLFHWLRIVHGRYPLISQIYIWISSLKTDKSRFSCRGLLMTFFKLKSAGPALHSRWPQIEIWIVYFFLLKFALTFYLSMHIRLMLTTKCWLSSHMNSIAKVDNRCPSWYMVAHFNFFYLTVLDT